MQTKLATIPVSSLKGVGPKVAEKLNRLSICSLEDLLFHLPLRYQDRSRIHPIASLQQGQTAQVCGMIEASDIVFGKRRSLVCKISDGTGILDIRLFYFSMAQKKQFVRGQYIQCYGQVSHTGKNFGMIHPELTYLKDSAIPKLQEGLQAVYPTTEGLQQRTFTSAIRQALSQLKRSNVTELIPQQWLEKLDFPPLADALMMLHQPPLDISLAALESGEHPLIKRLAFEELVAQHISLQKIKLKTQAHNAISFRQNKAKDGEFRRSLPFELTNAQNQVISEIQSDLEKKHPMMRLVQGDVGSGKTLVAALNMLTVVSANYQAILMAPTEILAEQHFKSFENWFRSFDINVTLLTSKMSAPLKRTALENIASGDSKIIIGTHALFQDQVQFNQLALVVIDEQHRFGVEQRKTLLEKSLQANQGKYRPHQLVMTATPIPRTLTQTAYADLDLSVIDELPPGRKPVTTAVVGSEKRDQVIERVKQACLNDHRQIYWVCTLIDESEELQCQAAEATHQQLIERLPELKVALIHGRMKNDLKQQVMNDFKAGKTDLLVATTVIEVGVDVPNASLMVIENPERLGLSQLHQLRGRVGRGEKESHCLLMYHGPLSQNAKQRLKVMRETNDGFVIAEKDLELRGPGEVLGTRQTGAIAYQFADIIRDSDLLPDVYFCANDLMENSPKLAEALCTRWVKSKEDLSRV
ncbi:ATP-dependent DNA helicase RecG [Aliikangiella coralliicola]|uniref:ATP-dependent DNA helicase RecG n=1 Tax=Aliikangiella coralliicola TaxID=2592383 RepID=A0A545U7M6_9GAMM|nr:ATP-dependent DNA helicase RecG [Aliikangiella coralliicola]TQV85476.1 ATP-dependent DNA helicase RecG [Aliikangiella coralliicola]